MNGKGERDWSRIRHFRREEWAEDPDAVDFGLVRRLDAVRAEAGLPVHVHVAYARAGHSKNSYHYKGMAVDFHFDPGLSALEEFTLLASHGFGGLGHYPLWRPRPGWHADIRPGASAVLWFFDGEYHYGWSGLAAVLNAKR